MISSAAPLLLQLNAFERKFLTDSSSLLLCDEEKKLINDTALTRVYPELWSHTSHRITGEAAAAVHAP